MYKIGIVSLILGAIIIAACEPVSPPATKPANPASLTAAVTGTVSYLTHSDLPATAVIEVVLQDVSRADASAKTISRERVEAQGKQAPFPYELRYAPATIDPTHTYAVRATIMDGGNLLFTSTQRRPVITNGAPTSNVEIIVEPVASSGRPSLREALTGFLNQCKPCAYSCVRENECST